MNVAQMYDLKADSDGVAIELRDHFMDLYQRTVIALLKKQQAFEDRIQQSEAEWQATCDKLIEDKQIQQQEQDKLEEKLDLTNAQLNSLKAEHYTLMSDNKEKSEKLTAEMQNHVNSEYLKNILLSYFCTNDASVQINLIRVVFQAMKFSDEEQEKVLEAHAEHSKGTMSRVIGSLF